MSGGLQPYPAYKDSGLPWLGKVPVYWEIRRNGQLFSQRNETGYGSLPILEVSLKTGVRVRDWDDLKRSQVMVDREKYKRAVKNDIAYNMMRMWQGAVGVAPVDGLVSPAYVVARPHLEVESRYFTYLFRTNAYMNEVDGYSRGIVKDRNRLYWEDFKRIPSCMPPLEEQRTISDYLDANAVMIRRFIRNRRGLIEVLNEQKQAIIHRAVTRGLDPHVSLQPTGIDWLRDVPERWEVRRLKTISNVIMGQSPPSSECNVDGKGRPFLQGSAEFGPLNPRSIQCCPSAPKTAPTEAILFSVRAPVGAMNIADQDYGIGRGLCAIIPYPEILDRTFAMHAISVSKVQLLMIATGSTYDAVSAGEVGIMRIPLPPLEEQQVISQHISDQTASLSHAIDRAEQEIRLIREYRSRLIADVVTGKVDVRHLVSEMLAKTASITAPKPTAGRIASVHFRRAVFAAEIVHRLHDESTFGHVKFQKLIFLCEKQCGVDTGSTYHRQAAGPYDNRTLRSIDSQIKKQQWYAIQKDDKRYWYVPLTKAGGHRTYFDRYFADIEDEFTRLIELFRKVNTEWCEIIATLYGAWEDLLKSGEEVTDDRIIEEVLHHWHPSKQRIDESRWRRALERMKVKNLVPRLTTAVEAEETECLEADEYVDELPEEYGDEVAVEGNDADD